MLFLLPVKICCRVRSPAAPRSQATPCPVAPAAGAVTLASKAIGGIEQSRDQYLIRSQVNAARSSPLHFKIQNLFLVARTRFFLTGKRERERSNTLLCSHRVASGTDTTFPGLSHPRTKKQSSLCLSFPQQRPDQRSPGSICIDPGDPRIPMPLRQPRASLGLARR